jgi:hypothetical protein
MSGQWDPFDDARADSERRRRAGDEAVKAVMESHPEARGRVTDEDVAAGSGRPECGRAG